MDNSLQDELKKLSRRIDTMQKSVDILNDDRNMLEDILTRLSAVEQALNLNKDHQIEMNKNIKEEIREAGVIAENAVLEVKDSLSEKTIVVSNTNNLFDKIKKKLRR